MEICYLPLFVEVLTSFPSGLEAEDIEDFCSLSQYYASRTPQSFRRVRLFKTLKGNWELPEIFDRTTN